MAINLVVACDNNRVIGKENSLPDWKLPNDLKWFKFITSDGDVVMGRKTFESIIELNGKPLPNRNNIVITRDVLQESVMRDDITVITTPESIVKRAKTMDFFIIGGEEIYKQFINLADTIIITQVHGEFDGDAYFPKIDYTEWHEELSKYNKADENNSHDHTFRILKRNY